MARWKRSKWPNNAETTPETSSETTTNNSATDVTHEQLRWWKLYDKKDRRCLSLNLNHA